MTTVKQLQSLVDSLNKVKGTPLAPYTKDSTGKIVPCPGNYHLDQVYGGVGLSRMADGGGVYTIFHTTTKANLAAQIRAYIMGLQGWSNQ
jgi:hypothetical protein